MESKNNADIILVYDFDGTLVDNMSSHINLAKECIVKHFGIDEETAQEEYIRTTGVPFDEQLKIIFPGVEKEKLRKECAQEYHSRKDKEVYKNAKNFPDSIKNAKEIMKQAIENGLSILQIITSGSETKILEKWLLENQLAKEFKLVMGRESGLKKDHFIKIRQAYPEASVFFISDSPRDMEVASQQNFKIFKIGFLGDYGQLTKEEMKKKRQLFFDKGGQKVINKLSELSGILFS